MTADSPLLQPIEVGAARWPNRLVMAPLTRGRAAEDGVPTAMMVEYYRLRAAAGLIVSEATAISPQGFGWYKAPGIWTQAQAEGWRKVTDAVHAEGGRIFLQLWHMGRLSHPDFHGGELPVSASAIAPSGHAHTPSGTKPYATPRALDAAELPGIVQDYARAARLAMEAGFDGVEIHGANGYLLDQFLRDGANRRSDAYGGPVENRARLLREVTQAVVEAIGAQKVGVRLSPFNPNGGISDSNPRETFTHAARMLDGFGLAYLHVLEFLAEGGLDNPDRVAPHMREAYRGTFIINGGFDQAQGEEALRRGLADAVAYGQLFIANPDLVERFRSGAPLNRPNPATFYTHGREGYLDYPLLGEKAA